MTKTLNLRKPVGHLRLSPEGIEDFLRGRYSKNTLRAYRRDLEDWKAFLGKPLETATLSDALAYLSHLKERGLRPATINRRLSSLRTIYGILEALEIVPKNPFDPRLIKGLKLKTDPPLGLSREEVRRLLASCNDGTIRGMRDRAILLLGLVALLRRSEIARLKWGDIREEGPFRVLVIRNAKGGPEQRVFLRQDVYEALMAYKNALEMTYGIESCPEDPVFRPMHRREGLEKALTDRMIDYIVRARAFQALISKKVSAHSLRHTGITLALQAGAPLDRVMAHARHKSPKTTLGYHRTLDNLENNAAEYIRW